MLIWFVKGNYNIPTNTKILDRGGKMKQSTSTNRKYSERNLQTTQKLNLSQQFEDFLVKTSIQAVLFVQNKQVIFATPRLEVISGYSLEEMKLFTWEEIKNIVHPEDKALIWKNTGIPKDQLVGGEDLEVRLIRKDGSIIWVNARIDQMLVDEIPTTCIALMDISNQKHAENNLSMREQVLVVLARAAQLFLSSSDWKSHLPLLLKDLGRVVGVSRVYYFEISQPQDDNLVASQIAEWCAQGISTQLDNPELQNMPVLQGWFASWGKNLAQNIPVFGIVRNLDPVLQKEFIQQNILSLLVVPIHSMGKWVGFIGFDDCVHERTWSTVEIETLQTVASLLGNAIQNQAAETTLKDANENLEQWNTILEMRNQEANLLNEFGELLQNCIREEDLFRVMQSYGHEFFPESTGAMYLLSPSLTKMEASGTWGNLLPEETSFEPSACWAYRKGHLHRVTIPSTGVTCQHVSTIKAVVPQNDLLLCAPIIAQADTLGILHIRTHKNHPIGQIEVLVNTLADRVGVTLNNLRLKEKLRQQSIRDPLTNLFNRRYLEETLEREIRRAERYHRSIGITMLDIDHFKLYNDKYGHTAGDHVLRLLGEYLRSQIRAEDVACRYGGEEFTLILIESNLGDTENLAESIRQGVSEISILYQGQTLEPITISGGVASYPEHGLDSESLLMAADKALYAAKHSGRNKIMVA